MIASFRRAAIRSLTLLLGRTQFRYDGGTYTVFEGVLNPTLFRASLIFAREALAVAGSDSIDILELGSGSGLTSVALARRGHRVIAVDSCLRAATNTTANAMNNAVNVRTVCSNWDTALKSDLSLDYVKINGKYN